MMQMIYKITKKYISIIFLLATFVSTFHHHDDLQIHSDCQICTIQNSIADGDTPIQPHYFTIFAIPSEVTLCKLQNFIVIDTSNRLRARAPPQIS